MFDYSFQVFPLKFDFTFSSFILIVSEVFTDLQPSLNPTEQWTSVNAVIENPIFPDQWGFSPSPGYLKRSICCRARIVGEDFQGFDDYQ